MTEYAVITNRETRVQSAHAIPKSVMGERAKNDMAILMWLQETFEHYGPYFSCDAESPQAAIQKLADIQAASDAFRAQRATGIQEPQP